MKLITLRPWLPFLALAAAVAVLVAWRLVAPAPAPDAVPPSPVMPPPALQPTSRSAAPPTAPVSALAPEAPYVLATTRPADLAALDGRRVRFRVSVDSAVDRRGDRDVFEARVRNGADLGTVELYAGGRIDDDMVVEATLRVLRHKAWLRADGTEAPGFTECRLLDAVRQ